MKRSILLLLIFGGTSLVLFQNCGEMKSISSSGFSSTGIDYPYSEKPKVYTDFYFFRPKKASSGSLYNYTFVAGISPAEEVSDNFSYLVTFKDASGNIICPSVSGNLKSINVPCTGIRTSEKIIVDMSVSYTGKTFKFQKIF